MVLTANLVIVCYLPIFPQLKYSLRLWILESMWSTFHAYKSEMTGGHPECAKCSIYNQRSMTLLTKWLAHICSMSTNNATNQTNFCVFLLFSFCVPRNDCSALGTETRTAPDANTKSSPQTLRFGTQTPKRSKNVQRWYLQRLPYS